MSETPESECGSIHPDARVPCWLPPGHRGDHKRNALVWGRGHDPGCILDKDHIEPDCQTSDPVHHPRHYTNHPSGVECLDIVEHMSFCLGNVVKYCWRAGQKGPAVEDLKKAQVYLEREIKRLERE